MNLTRIKILFTLFFIAMGVSAENGIKESPFSASLELSTKYMWRGIE